VDEYALLYAGGEAPQASRLAAPQLE